MEDVPLATSEAETNAVSLVAVFAHEGPWAAGCLAIDEGVDDGLRADVTGFGWTA